MHDDDAYVEYIFDTYCRLSSLLSLIVNGFYFFCEFFFSKRRNIYVFDLNEWLLITNVNARKFVDMGQ